MRIVISYILAFLAATVPAFAADPPAPDAAVTFSLVKPDAREVALAGSFNQWDREQHRLAGPDRNGRWTITLPLAPGRYEYLFVVNSTDWVPDPAAPTVSDGLGGKNSVLLVPDRER
jgi:1,4-alpha-glucan branching enzyme